MMKKTFEIDIDSVDDIKKYINILKSYIGQINAKDGTRPKIKQEKFDACLEILSTDISDLYEEFSLDLTPSYYVYAHSEPDRKIAIGKDGVTTFAASIGFNSIPFYIGKGIGDRAFDLNRNETHRKIKQRLKKFNKEVVIEIIKTDLTELEALCLESKLIDIFGLLPNGGKLVNLDEGVKSKERQDRYKSSLIKLNELYKNSLKVG